MNIVAFFLVVLAIVGLLYEQFARQPHKTVLPLSLALFAASFMVEAVWATGHTVIIH